MNGSRLNEHRQPKVSFESWFLLVGVIMGLLILGPIAAKGQEYEPYVKYTATMVAGTEICFSPDLSVHSKKLLNTWQRLVNELEAYRRGGPRMHEEDANLGQLLYDNQLCGSIVDYYDIVILQETEGYALAKYKDSLGFDEGTFIVAKLDIIPDRGI
jgi:hypothetical protein